MVKYISNNKHQFYFIIINIITGFVGFIRAFVFMKYYSFYELGIITLLNTSVMLVSLFQIGLLNGGYRIYSLKKEGETKIVNNTINSYLLILLASILFIYIFSKLFKLNVNNIYLLLGGITGVLTLSRNWITNILIASTDLKMLNRINIITNSISVFLLALVPFWGLLAAFFVIISQPVLFVLISVLVHKEFIPTNFSFKIKDIRWILVFGFIPFISGILDQVNIQIQNWSIKSILSEEYLGHFYLVPLYVTLFMLIPKSLNNLFFPKAMRLYNDKLYNELKQYLKKYFLLLISYSAVITIITFFLIKPVIKIVFPEHIIGVEYVFYVLPGLIAMLMYNPIGMLYNASVKLKPMLLASIMGVLLNSIVIYFFWRLNIFTLQNISILKSFIGLSMLLCYIFSYFYIRKKIWVK